MGPIPRCTAKEGINHPINVTNDTDLMFVTDVGKVFYQMFILGLVLNFVIVL